MVSFIDENREGFGVEPICAQLPIAPSGYYGAKSRPPSARARRDATLVPELVALWQANYRVYGAHKLWRAARRAGIDVGRDQVARLMRLAGIEGIRRRRRVRTHPARRRRCAASGPRGAGLFRRGAEPAVGQRLDLCGDVGGRSVCVFHRRRRQPADRRLARRGAHAHRHGPRRTRDGPRVPRDAPGGLGGALRRRQSIHVRALG